MLPALRSHGQRPGGGRQGGLHHDQLLPAVGDQDRDRRVLVVDGALRLDVPVVVAVADDEPVAPRQLEEARGEPDTHGPPGVLAVAPEVLDCLARALQLLSGVGPQLVGFHVAGGQAVWEEGVEKLPLLQVVELAEVLEDGADG